MIRTSGNFTNDIIINNTHINRIYNKGEIYWGNDYTPAPPVPTGCLSTYQNDPDWSTKASIMSELDAPDPLSI